MNDSSHKLNDLLEFFVTTADLDECSHEDKVTAWNSFIFTNYGERLGLIISGSKLIDRKGDVVGWLNEPCHAKNIFSNYLEDGDFEQSVDRWIHSAGIMQLVSQNIKEVNLDGFFFPGSLGFSNCRIKHYFRMSNTTIRGRLFISNCEIGYGVIFNNCTISEGFLLMGKEIKPTSNFNMKSISLNGCRMGGVTLHRISLEEKFTCSDTSMSGAFVIFDTTFADSVEFEAFSTTSSLKFQKTTFSTFAPNFSGAQLQHETSWIMCIWPNIPDQPIIQVNKLIQQTREEIISRNIAAYETLSHLMSRLEKHHDKHMFYRKSMRWRREIEPSSTIKVIDIVYEFVSGYGYKLEAVIKTWLYVIFGGGVCVFPFQSYKPAIPTYENLYTGLWVWIDAFIISFSNVCGFLGLSRGPLKGYYDSYPKDATLIPFTLTWTIQIVLGLILVFSLA